MADLAQPPAKRRRFEVASMPSSPTPTTSSSLLCPPAMVVGCDPAAMQRQLAALVDDGAVRSAELLAELLLALADRGDDRVGASASASTFHARTCELMGDALVAKREFRRAIQYYGRARSLMAMEKREEACANEQECDGKKKDAAVATKVARCWSALDKPEQAMETLMGVPEDVRPLSALLLLGSLYRQEGLKVKAEENYTRALQMNPYALEAALALTELAAAKEATSSAFGGSGDPVASEIETFYLRAAHSTVGESGSQEENAAKTNPVPSVDTQWMQQLVSAHLGACRGQYRSSARSFDALDAVFPNNLHALLHRAKLELDNDLLHQSHLLFQRARQVDALNLELMDAYADVLRRSNARSQLSHVVRELFDVSDVHAEPWLAASYYSSLKGEPETALQFCDRAVGFHRRRASAHLFRGELLLALHRPEHALSAFMTSCKLHRGLEAYAGVVSSYCELYSIGVNRYKEAVTTARSVVKLFPRKAKSYTLLGRVYALRSEHQDEAKRALLKALTLDPRNVAATMALADVMVSDGECRSAIDRLRPLAEHRAREDVLTKLAHVLVLDKQYVEAMNALHRAQALNPASREVGRALDRVERLLRGEDPDDVELSTSMDHLDGEGEDDEQEGSALVETGEYLTS